ncbi:hypothetical protein JTE90_007639 [Oedothorax gibbosus]|uniref:Uncharacterized protein n=1 Tax=Oedothorax gibbosus TaxID=931172 RepID=A0AAV6TLF5_9ARAC|nr:hypothetical protein JTE90_007639 [Oedothorax gibbosus]
MSASYPEGKIRRNPLQMVRLSYALDPDLTIDLHVSNRYGPPPQIFPWPRPRPGDSSPSFGSQRVRVKPPLPTSGKRRSLGAPRPPRERGSRMRPHLRPACTFISPPGLFKTP